MNMDLRLDTSLILSEYLSCIILAFCLLSVSVGDISPDQLLRYYNYGRKRFPNGFKLLYLTLNGSEPNDCSLGNKKFDFQTISYNNEIISWLEQCSELARDKKNAQIIINQYCDLVKELTVKDMDKKYIEKLKEITLAPENVAAVGEILKIQENRMPQITHKTN